MMMDDFLGHIQGAGGGNGQEDDPQQQQQQQAVGRGANHHDVDIVDLDFFMGLDNSQNPIGESFLSSLSSRVVRQSTSMDLTDVEMRWAQDLKGAVEASTEHDLIRNLTDMEIVQYALVSQGHVLDALQRIHTIQAFKKTYDIQDTAAQGMECVEALLDQQDGVYLDVDTNPQTQEPVVVLDLQSFFPSRALEVNTSGKGVDYNWKVLARGFYYLHRACQSTLASVRHGLFLVADCEGVGWDNIDLECDKRLHAELFSAYPVKYKKIMAYNTALVANVYWGLSKRHWSNESRKAVELGCRLVDTDSSKPLRRMADLYRQPDAQASRLKVLRRVAELLSERDANELDYKLQPRHQPASIHPLLRTNSRHTDSVNNNL